MSLYEEILSGMHTTPEYGAPAITLGVVTSIEDPDEKGKVKVRLLNRTTSQSETDFIRVMTPMCGQGWGMWFSPEVGDEVVVAFCDQSAQQPLIIGSLYNDIYTIPAKLEDKEVVQRVIKSKTGNVMLFQDREGEEGIDLITAQGMKISMADKEKVMVLQDKDEKNIIKLDSETGELTITADKKIILTAGRASITLDGSSGKITVESGGSLELKGQQISAEAQSSMELKAQASLEIKSTGQLNIEATGIANVKGSMLKLN